MSSNYRAGSATPRSANDEFTTTNPGMRKNSSSQFLNSGVGGGGGQQHQPVVFQRGSSVQPIARANQNQSPLSTLNTYNNSLASPNTRQNYLQTSTSGGGGGMAKFASHNSLSFDHTAQQQQQQHQLNQLNQQQEAAARRVNSSRSSSSRPTSGVYDDSFSSTADVTAFNNNSIPINFSKLNSLNSNSNNRLAACKGISNNSTSNLSSLNENSESIINFYFFKIE
jgi:hypothetical protein